MISTLALLSCLAASRPASAEPAVLQDIQLSARQVTLKLSRPVGYRASSTVKPPAVIVTLDDARIADAVRDKSAASAWVAGVTVLPVLADGVESARVILKLGKPRGFEVSPSGNDVLVQLKEAAPAAPATAAAAPPAASTAAAAGAAPVGKDLARYFVQVGSYPTEAEADDLKGQIDSESTPTEIRKAEVGGKAMFKVLVGPPQNRPAARALAEQLKKLGYPGFLYKE